MLQVLPAVYGVVAVLLAVWPVDVGAASSLRRIALSAGTRCRVTEFAGSLRGPSDCAGESHRAGQGASRSSRVVCVEDS